MTKKLLEKDPALLNATMDWGGGDWETGLGGASHMGRRDIVQFLLERGARIDIFCVAMMGQLDALKSFIALGYPIATLVLPLPTLLTIGYNRYTSLQHGYLKRTARGRPQSDNSGVGYSTAAILRGQVAGAD